MFLFYIWVRLFKHHSEREIWDILYFQPQWQTFFDIFNAIPLLLIGFVLCWKFNRHHGSALFASMLLHCAFDLPLHHDDGHRHFWPLTDFRFASPISYWDPNQHGFIGAGIEVLLLTCCTLWIFQKNQRRWWHWLILTLNILFAGLYLYFYL